MTGVILDNREFSFVEKHLVGKKAKLKPICQKVLQKYIDLVIVQVEKKTADALPSNVGIFVGWMVTAKRTLYRNFWTFPN